MSTPVRQQPPQVHTKENSMSDTPTIPTTAELVAAALADFNELCHSIASDIGALADLIEARA